MSYTRPPSPLNEARILGVMPDYQTVRDTTRCVAPLITSQKWLLAEKETADPFNIASAAMTAAFSQAGNRRRNMAKAGWLTGKRFGAALADGATRNFFSAGNLMSEFWPDVQQKFFRKKEK